MIDRDASRYYKKINTTFVGVNKQDDFAKMFINLLESGNTTLYQKERRERRIFDDSWMDSVEQAIPVIDKLTRKPRETLKKTSMVVPVERAKKIDKETVRHLSQNTQLIRSIDREGNVIPSKVLTSFSESDLGTYENRFLRSLVDNLFIFIEKRYDLIIKKMHTEYVNFLNVKSEIEWMGATIDYDVTFQIHQNMEQDEIDQKNQVLLDRITEMRTSITNFKMSKFMLDMKAFPGVVPPIMQTNLLQKNVDFRKCYDLWILIEQVDRIGYDVDVFERNVEFKDKYLADIENAMMVLYAAVANNQTSEFVLNQQDPYVYRKTRRPKVMKNNPADITIDPGYYQLENYGLSQYYLEQIKKSNYSRFKTLTEAGITLNESVDIVFKQLGNITNAVYEDYIQTNYHPETKETLEEKVAVQEEIIELYKKIEQIKRDDLKTLATQKAIALLNLRNYKDDIAKKKELERLEEEKEKELERLEKERQKKIREEERLAKQRKIEAAKKILAEEKAKRKAREKKKQRSVSSKKEKLNK
ncbi:MAG: hypothetical protein AB7U79_01125 [Candidatus Izemoplasmatales bacterium]